MEGARLVIYEEGTRTGHITATGSIGYIGSNSYIEQVLEHFEDGRTYAYSTGTSDGPFKARTIAETGHGENLFESVRARLEPLSDVEVRVKSSS